MRSESRWLLLGLVRESAALPVFVAILVMIATLPTIARGADRLGLPGGTIALGLMLLLVFLAAFAVWTTFPGTRRGRLMARAARELGLRYRRRLRVPASLAGLPSISATGRYRTFANLLGGRRHDRSFLVFDIGTAADTAYAPAHWVTSAATESDLDAPSLAIEPRHDVAIRDGSGLARIGSESTEFDRRYRVICSEAMFATAVVDARMMEWLLQTDAHYAFELGGPWVLVSRPLAEPRDLPSMLDTLEAFMSHIPRVAASFHPAPSVPFS